MALTSVGTLPVSALNIGLGATIPLLDSQILDLQASISGLQIALAAQLQLGINLPSITLPSLSASFAAQLNNLSTLLNPATWITAGVGINASVALKLGLVNISIAAALQLKATFQAGLSAGSLSFWTYSGRAAGFGPALRSHTERGWGAVAQLDSVQGLVVATESPSSWGSLGFGFNTGASARAAANAAKPAPGQATGSGSPARLIFEGVLGGGQLNTGVLRFAKELDLFLLKLTGLQASLQLQLSVSLGLHLPPIGALAASLNAVLPSIALDNLLNVKLDLAASISGLQLRISILLQLIADISLSLSAGGLSMWTYSGVAGDLGAALASATSTGLPGGSGPETPAYGLVIMSQFPAAMAAFGGIFKAA